MIWRTLAEFAAHLLFPQCCPICGAIGRTVCPECLDGLMKKYPEPQPACLVCGGPAPCLLHGNAYEVRSLMPYLKECRELILNAKYSGNGRLARVLGERLAKLLDDLGGGWTITAIPPHRKANVDTHLDCAVSGLSRVTGYPVRNALRWRSQNRPQKEKGGREARKALSEDCFACEQPPEKVILVDDVMTTGTTLQRGAGCLYAAGAARVLCLSWGRTPEQ